MSEAFEIAVGIINKASGAPQFLSFDDARIWVVDQWPDWKIWIGPQMLDNITEAVCCLTVGRALLNDGASD